MKKLSTIQSTKTFRLRLESRLKNAALVNARENLGITAKEAAEKMKVGYSHYVGIECMREYPSLETQQKICSFYRNNDQFLYEEDVFPISLSTTKFVRKYITEKEIPQDKLVSLSQISDRYLPQIDSGLDRIVEEDLIKTQRDFIDYCLDRLTPTQRTIVSQHMGLDKDSKSLEIISRERGVSIQSVKQTLDLAIRRIRRIANVKYKFTKSNNGYIVSERDTK